MNKVSVIHLIHRDFRAYKVQILALSCFILVLSMFITFVNTHTLRIFSSGIGNVIMIILGTFAVEQSNNVIRIHTASLPVSRKEIVFARFVSSLIIVLLNTVMHFIVFNLLTMFIHQEPVHTTVGLFLFAMIYGVFQLSVYYLIFYRANLVISMIIFVLPIMIWTAISPNSGFLKELALGDPWYLLLFTLGTFLLLPLSFYTTVRYYRSKDL